MEESNEKEQKAENDEEKETEEEEQKDEKKDIDSTASYVYCPSLYTGVYGIYCVRSISALEKYRIYSKNKWKEHLEIHGETFRNKLGFTEDKYIVRQIVPSDRKQLINILCYQFSSNGGPSFKVFGLSVHELYPYCVLLFDHAIETGLNYVIFNKERAEVIAVVFSWDHYDQPNFDNLSQSHSNCDHLLELFNQMSLKDKLYKEYITDVDVKYGDIFNLFIAVFRPKMVTSGFGAALPVLSDVIAGELGYRTRYTYCTHPAAIKIGKLYSEKFDFHKHTTDSLGLNDIGFVNDYYTKLQTSLHVGVKDYYTKLETKYIDKIKEHFDEQHVAVLDYNMIDFIDKYKDYGHLLVDAMERLGVNGKAGWIMEKFDKHGPL